MDPAMATEAAALVRTRVINSAIELGGSHIQQFYKHTTLLLTGGTGFMGKQILEKLIRSCDIKKVFIIMRPKKGKTMSERLDYMLQDPVFDSVKKMKPGFENKIYPIQGDAEEPRFGIADEDLEKMITETEIIIHAAATISFNEPLRVAVNTNVRGTVDMLDIAKHCTNLKAFVHVSTAYAHATEDKINKEVAEQFYEAPLSPQLAIEMVATIDEQRLEDITPSLIKNWPNTYTFTKAIAEEAVRQASSQLPISVVRPAIVIAAYVEPSPGWLDPSTALGPGGIVLGAGMGVMHTIHRDPDIKLDLVPVDLVNNTIIASAWLAAQKHAEGCNERNIYTFTSMRNPVTFRTLEDIIRTKGPSYQSPKTMYYSFSNPTKHKVLFLFFTWLWHYIPAYIIDFILMLIGKSPMAVKLYTKVVKLTEVLGYFMSSEWQSKDTNTQDMFARMSEQDKNIFNCDVGCVQWNELLIFWIIGIRKYILKDGLRGTDTGIRKQFWFSILHYALVLPLYLLFLYKVASLAIKLVYCIFKLFTYLILWLF